MSTFMKHSARLLVALGLVLIVCIPLPVAAEAAAAPARVNSCRSADTSFTFRSKDLPGGMPGRLGNTKLWTYGLNKYFCWDGSKVTQQSGGPFRSVSTLGGLAWEFDHQVFGADHCYPLRGNNCGGYYSSHIGKFKDCLPAIGKLIALCHLRVEVVTELWLHGDGSYDYRSYQRSKPIPAIKHVAAPTSGGACAYEWGGTLRLNASGRRVRELQRRLNRSGAQLALDGIFGQKTQQAVIRFQQARKLQADGIVGPKTQAALNKLCP